MNRWWQFTISVVVLILSITVLIHSYVLWQDGQTEKAQNETIRLLIRP